MSQSLNPNVLISFACGHHVLPPEPVLCLEDLKEDLKLFERKLSRSCSWRLSICCRGISALLSSVLGPSPLSTVPFSSGTALSFLMSQKPGHCTVGTAIWRRRHCQMVSRIICRPYCISPSVVLALSTILTHSSLQPPPALILLGVWFKAHKICSHHVWTLRQDQRWAQTMLCKLMQFLGTWNLCGKHTSSVAVEMLMFFFEKSQPLCPWDSYHKNNNGPVSFASGSMRIKFKCLERVRAGQVCALLPVQFVHSHHWLFGKHRWAQRPFPCNLNAMDKKDCGLGEQLVHSSLSKWHLWACKKQENIMPSKTETRTWETKQTSL